MYITITSVSRATSPASVSTITSGDSFSTITSSNFSSDFDPFLNYKIFTNSRITINMDNPSEQIPSISQFEEDFDNLSKFEKNKNMDNFNQSLIDVVNNDYNGNINFINEGMNQDSSAIVSPREEERTKESQNKFQQNDDNFNNEVTKFNDNQSTMSTLEEQKSSDDPITLPQAEQIANMLIDINNNKITSNNIFSSNNENDITCNTLVLPKPNASSTSDDTLDNRNLISENIVLDNYNKMQSFDVRNGNDLILSYIDKDNMEIQQEDDEICLKRDNEINKESTNNEFNNDNNNERKEIVDIKTKVVVKQEYGRITLALKDQLALYNKFREVIPENVRKQVENTVGVISFTYHQPNQTDGVHVTSDDPMGESIPQENDSDFLSSTESNSSEQNQVKVKKSTRTMNGYNYYIKKQFKKSKNKSRKARDVISSSAKKWLELPANIKKHYQSKAKLGREKVSVKQNRLYGRKNQQPRQPRIDTPGENESEVLAVVIPIDSELRYKFQ